MSIDFSVKIEKVSREYVERMIKFHETGRGNTTDQRIDCPFCDMPRAMEFNRFAFKELWNCLYRDCESVLPKGMAPPGPEEFKRLIQLKKDLETLVKWDLV